MAYDTEVDDGLRGTISLGEDGDLEITWDSENDEKVRAIIQAKMEKGVCFQIMKPIVGDMLHMRKKLTKMSDLKTRNIKIKDRDIAALFEAGDVSMFRATSGATIETTGVIRVRKPDGTLDHHAASKIAVKTRTVSTPALQGG